MLESNSLTIHGNGSQTRSFTYIEDVVEGFVEAGLRNLATGGVFNIGSTEEISVLELAKKIAHYGNQTELNFGEGYHGDVARRVPNIDNSRAGLDWQSTTKLDEGLALMWQTLSI